MTTERRTRLLALALWVGLVELALLATQILPESIFLHTPVAPTICLGVFIVAVGIYGYLENRLTPSKAVWMSSCILLGFSVPNIIMKALVGSDW